MTINLLGPVAAITAFFSMWFGHVAVRKIEAISPKLWIPSTIFAILGVFCEWFSLKASNLQAATIFGILGITLLFDSFEFIRQQRRIMKGHAPANPDNPRHAKILREYLSATTLDLLKREPMGSPLTIPENPRVMEKR
jgi:uncharacterized membrane protein YfcA